MHRSQQTPDTRRHLALVTALTPVIAQFVMLICLVAAGQWLFAAMTLPSLIGCAASALMMLPRSESHDAPERAALTSSTPHSVGFTAMHSLTLESLLHLDTLPWRSIVTNWLALAPDLQVPIGTDSGGVFSIDLTTQGPHALVAGTTGSGKSVLLRTWCLAMAARMAPDRLNFVFLDFKGGAAFRELDTLPHTVGNVSDLSLEHATRALRALECELARRERLVADQGVSTMQQARSPAPRLVIVVDEFHALKDQLPDYVDRLTRIASLGRSLNMHLIACTQNPLGQVGSTMKANMSLNICLRVRDAMQSTELLGDGRAGLISPATPGAAYCNDAERVTAFRCAHSTAVARMCTHIRLASRFVQIPHAPALFGAPLPKLLPYAHEPSDEYGLWFGLADNGVTLEPATVPLRQGCILIVGGHGRGKSSLLVTLHYSATRVGRRTRLTRRTPEGYVNQSNASDAPELWFIDDADDLLDPLCTDPLADELRQALSSSAITVVLSIASRRHWRYDEYCATALIFPCGERSCDLWNGIPASLMQSMNPESSTIAGRVVMTHAGQAQLAQCATSPNKNSWFFS